MNSVSDVWTMVLNKLREELSETSINTWFDEVIDVHMVGRTFYIDCPNEFKREMIDTMFRERIVTTLNDLFSAEFKLEVRDGKGPDPSLPQQPILLVSDKFTFDNFVVGESNKLAYAAARAVADGASAHYNPLFIYGDSGLGKTHLIYAILHQFRKRLPLSKIVYVKGDDFLNDFIAHVRQNKGDEFRAKYRDGDLLLVDDVQFVAGKEQSQNEFFHTFNTLYEAGHQIVLTSDRTPSEMTLLDDRLRTRFEWGLMVDVQPPDYETRVAIIKNKAIQRGFTIDDKSADYIARNVTTNVRRIEGVVNMLMAHTQLGRSDMSDAEMESMVREAVRENNEAVPTPDIIISEVARYFAMEEAVLRGPSRSRQIVSSRNIAMYLIRNITGLSTIEIGKIFGRDHTTALHSLDQVTEKLETDPSVSQAIKDITLNINSRR
ncbi:MAG: chromosomal replication initiator protein DnaA [Oscillospiraceae bacterium]|nr:chromosomal replication initiator protein DnaA [Oscillospiraceae bacterium]